MEHEILIDGDIGSNAGEISSSIVRRQLAQANGGAIVVKIHSPGGSVFEGLAIHDLLAAYTGKKRCVIEGAALSMGSVIAMAFSDRSISPNGYTMIHSPYSDEDENKPLLDSMKHKLAAIYSAATKKPVATILGWMQAETFFDAAESLRHGFVNAIQSVSSPVAVARYNNLIHRNTKFRACVVARLKASTTGTTATARWRGAVDAAMVGGLTKWKAIVAVDQKYPGLRQKMIDEANGR
jgi:ATP-dependent protease ClpP protease subunit